MITKKILPTLPLFENVVSQLEGANFFSGLDLTSMFYQLRIREEDIEKTTFRTAIGNYAYVVTPMGTTGSVGSTALMMQSALSHVISLPDETTATIPTAEGGRRTFGGAQGGLAEIQIP